MKATAKDNTVMVYWQDGDTTQAWNEACAYAVEHFGLPGDRFTTEVSSEWMAFNFKEQEDALMFRLGV